MANKNTKQYRAALAKAKQAVTCQRVRTAPGTSDLRVQNFTLNYGNPGRKSDKDKPKVAAKGGGGPSLMEQSKQFYGHSFISR